MPPEPPTVWRARTVEGLGWVRDALPDPIVTGTVAEAHQWADEADARAAVERWNRRRGYLPLEVYAGPATPAFRHGAPTPAPWGSG